jgi:hypothetical protein
MNILIFAEISPETGPLKFLKSLQAFFSYKAFSIAEITVCISVTTLANDS